MSFQETERSDAVISVSDQPKENLKRLDGIVLNTVIFVVAYVIRRAILTAPVGWRNQWFVLGVPYASLYVAAVIVFFSLLMLVISLTHRGITFSSRMVFSSSLLCLALMESGVLILKFHELAANAKFEGMWSGLTLLGVSALAFPIYSFFVLRLIRDFEEHIKIVCEVLLAHVFGLSLFGPPLTFLLLVAIIVYNKIRRRSITDALICLGLLVLFGDPFVVYAILAVAVPTLLLAREHLTQTQLRKMFQRCFYGVVLALILFEVGFEHWNRYRAPFGIVKPHYESCAVSSDGQNLALLYRSEDKSRVWFNGKWGRKFGSVEPESLVFSMSGDELAYKATDYITVPGDEVLHTARNCTRSLLIKNEEERDDFASSTRAKFDANGELIYLYSEDKTFGQSRDKNGNLIEYGRPRKAFNNATQSWVEVDDPDYALDLDIHIGKKAFQIGKGVLRFDFDVSGNGQHWYVALNHMNGSATLYLDGALVWSGMRGRISPKSVMFSRDGSKLAFVVEEGERSRAFLSTGLSSPEYLETKLLKISEDGTRFGIAGEQDEVWMLSVHSEEHGPFQEILDWNFCGEDNDWLASVKREDKFALLLNGEEIEVDKEGRAGYPMKVSNGFKRIVFTMIQDDGERAVVNGVEHPRAEEIAGDSIVFSENGEHYAYIGKQWGLEFPVVNDVAGWMLPEVKNHLIYLSNTGNAAWLTDAGETTYLLINGSVVSRHVEIIPESVRWSADDEIQYIAFDGIRWLPRTFRANLYRHKVPILGRTFGRASRRNSEEDTTREGWPMSKM